MPRPLHVGSGALTELVDGELKTKTRYIAMGMPKIKIHRYDTTGGTEEAPPVGKFWAGYVEPDSKKWILYIREDGTPFFFGYRDPVSGACMEPPITVRVNGQDFPSQHGMGAEVHVVFNATAGDYLRGVVSGVKFTDYGKVLYDVRLEIPSWDNNTPGGSTIVHDIDSCFVLPPPPEEEKWSGEKASRYGLDEPVKEEGEATVVPAPAFQTQANGGKTLVTGPELQTPSSIRPRETQANFDLDKLAEIWPEKYGEMAAAIRLAVEAGTVSISQLPGETEASHSQLPGSERS